MRLRRIGARERKRRKLGAAIEYELVLSQMGGSIGPDGATVYLGPSQVLTLYDVLDSAAIRERDSMAEQIWSDLMAAVERIRSLDPPESPEEELDLVESQGQARGLAFALAVLANPRHPNIDAIRAESVARWDGPADD